MTLRAWFSDGWSIFFTAISVTIFVTFTAPALFGLQNYTQWGGMYDDHWCHAQVYTVDPYKNPGAKRDEITAGDMGQPRVYSAPSHNRLTCLVWVKTFCGQRSKDGWLIGWVEPKLQSQLYLGPRNACTISLPGTERWYFHAQR